MICCLGPDSNFAPGKLMSADLANIVAATGGAGVKSLVMLSGITLSTGEELSLFNRWVARFFCRVFQAAALALSDCAVSLLRATSEPSWAKRIVNVGH